MVWDGSLQLPSTEFDPHPGLQSVYSSAGMAELVDATALGAGECL